MTTENNPAAEANVDDFFGTSKSGSDINWKTHALSEDGPNVFRIAPPVKSLKNVGKWKVYDRLHYGYTVANEQNPDKPRHKPFRCIHVKNRATQMVEQDCPECGLLEAKEQEIKNLVSQYIAQGKSEEDAEEYVKGPRKLLKEHNLDKKHYMLAKNLAGEWGILKLGHRAATALEDEIAKYKKENKGADPLNARSGVWFEFTRKGKGVETRYAVTVATESLGGGKFQHKSGELTRLDVEQLMKCPDLARVNDNKTLSYDQINALVRSGGEPSVVAQVFGQSRRRTESSPDPVPTTNNQALAPAPVSTPVPAPVQAATPTPVPDELALLRAKIAALEAGTAAPARTPPPAPPAQLSTLTPPATPPAKAPAQKASMDELMKMDPSQFLQMFPDPNSNRK